MRPESAAFIWDALGAAREIGEFLDGVPLNEYLTDVLRRRAVERGFEIVGEALNNLRRVDPATAAQIPGLREAVGLRNILIHGYAEIVDERIYDTAHQNVPDLIQVLSGLLDQIGEP